MLPCQVRAVYCFDFCYISVETVAVWAAGSVSYKSVEVFNDVIDSRFFLEWH